MSLIKWTPFLDTDIFNEMDRAFAPMSSHVKSFVPAIDVYQTDNDVIVETPLPGIDPEKIDISIENDVLTIQGKSEKSTEVEEKNYYRKEVRAGAFHRSVALPASVKGDDADASYDNGVLKIVIPKKEEVKPKKVKINVKK